MFLYDIEDDVLKKYGFEINETNKFKFIFKVMADNEDEFHKASYILHLCNLLNNEEIRTDDGFMQPTLYKTLNKLLNYFEIDGLYHNHNFPKTPKLKKNKRIWDLELTTDDKLSVIGAYVEAYYEYSEWKKFLTYLKWIEMKYDNMEYFKKQAIKLFINREFKRDYDYEKEMLWDEGWRLPLWIIIKPEMDNLISRIKTSFQHIDGYVDYLLEHTKFFYTEWHGLHTELYFASSLVNKQKFVRHFDWLHENTFNLNLDRFMGDIKKYSDEFIEWAAESVKGNWKIKRGLSYDDELRYI